MYYPKMIKKTFFAEQLNTRILHTPFVASNVIFCKGAIPVVDTGTSNNSCIQSLETGI
jgi:hypothetical protein